MVESLGLQQPMFNNLVCVCVCERDKKVYIYIYDLYPQTDKDFCWQDVSVYSTLKQEWRGFFSKCYVTCSIYELNSNKHVLIIKRLFVYLFFTFL